MRSAAYGAVRRAGALVALLAAILGGGCLQQVPEPEERASAVVRSFLEGCTRESRERAAALLTDLARTSFLAADSAATACAEALGISAPQSQPPAVTFGEAEVRRVDLHGDVGWVRLRSGDGEESRVDLEDVGGSWLLAGPR